MRRTAAILAGLVLAAAGFAASAAPASAAPMQEQAVSCGPVSFSPSGLTAYITCSNVNGYPRYQVRMLCPNYGYRYGPVRPVGQQNYAACLSASAGEGPPQSVEVRGTN